MSAAPGKRRPEGARLDLDFEDMKSGFAVGKAAAMAEWFFRKELREFAPIVNRLRVLRWQRENPDKHREKSLRHVRKPAVRAKLLAQAKRRRAARHRAEGTVYTCLLDTCGAQFCRVRPKGPAPRFCTEAHWQAWNYRQKADPAKKRPCKRCGGLGHNRRGCLAGVS